MYDSQPFYMRNVSDTEEAAKNCYWAAFIYIIFMLVSIGYTTHSNKLAREEAERAMHDPKRSAMGIEFGSNVESAYLSMTNKTYGSTSL